MTDTQLSIYLVINIFVAAYIVVISFLRRESKGGKSIFVLSMAILFCYLLYLHNFLSTSDLIQRISFAFTYFGTVLAATAIFTFSLAYTSQNYRVTFPQILLFSIIPVLTQILFWIPNDTNIIRSIFIERLNILYRYSLLTASLLLLSRPIKLWFSVFKIKSLSLIIGPSVALISHAILLLDLNWGLFGHISLLSLNLCAIGFAYNAFQRGSLAELFVNRTAVVENMEDGWIVLDTKHTIIDFNYAITRLFNVSRRELQGKPVSSIIETLPNLVRLLEENREIEVDRTLKVGDEYRYLNIQSSTLRNQSDNPIGHLITWRDITDRRRAEDARQQARDEMFVLLNAISSSASQTTSVTDFLTDVIYQIIYPFRSQIIFFFILDERSKEVNEDVYYLAAHLGIAKEGVKKLNMMSNSIPMLMRLSEKRQFVLLENTPETTIPEPMQELNMACFLAIPLTIQGGESEKIIGGLFLGRKENPIYQQDEIVRLKILADHIATLVDSDRRRKLAISLSERQRLMRDVHDSVSQKLYGLVTLTEAAQATLEAGSELDYENVLSRIGENARQAVKELRLFLFQMLPVDLEKEGLIAVLHHRLAAVEGRADIKVRFLADEPLQISKRKEVALYYIAQEALNNVLRHARAKSVSVSLKQGYKYVTLEITDDGCGFDKDKLNLGGMGLNNIKERVRQENGKLKISSKEDKGTIIKVTMEKDQPDRLNKNS